MRSDKRGEGRGVAFPAAFFCMACVAAALFQAFPARGEEAVRTLTLEECLALSEANHPDLAGADAKREAERRRLSLTAVKNHVQEVENVVPPQPNKTKKQFKLRPYIKYTAMAMLGLAILAYGAYALFSEKLANGNPDEQQYVITDSLVQERLNQQLSEAADPSRLSGCRKSIFSKSFWACS